MVAALNNDNGYVQIQAPADYNCNQLPEVDGCLLVPDAPLPSETFDANQVTREIGAQARGKATTAYNYASNPVVAAQLMSVILCTLFYCQYAAAAAIRPVQALSGFAATRAADAAVDNRVGKAVASTVFGNAAYAATKATSASIRAVNWNLHAPRDQQVSVARAIFA